MPIVSDEGVFENKLQQVVAEQGLGASTEPAGALKTMNDPLPRVRISTAPEPSGGVEDRRNDPNPNEPKWENVLPSLKEIAMRGGAYLGIPGMDTPLADEVPPNELSKSAGYDQIKIEKQIDSQSLLDRAIDDLLQGTQFFHSVYNAIKDKGPAYHTSDTPFSQVEFSKGLLNRDAPIGNTKLARQVEDFQARASAPITGKIYFSPEDIDQAINVGMGAGPGTIMGVRSRILDKTKLYKAQNMALDGIDPTTIWKETGTYKGPDGRWRQEIPDINSVLKSDGLEWGKTTVHNPTGWTSPHNHGDIIETVGVKRSKEGVPVKDLLAHEDLYAAYPQIAETKIFNLKDYPNPEKMDLRNVEGVRTHEGIYMKDASPAEFRSVLMHELQHSIQYMEGFAKGGNPGQFKPPELPRAIEEFEKAKKWFNDTMAEKKIDPEIYRGAIEAEINGNKEAFKNNPEVSRMINRLIEDAKKKGIYSSLKNIIQSEKLLAEEERRVFEVYQRLAGEVEARNVQTRIDFGIMDRMLKSPIQTQDRPSFVQIVH